MLSVTKHLADQTLQSPSTALWKHVDGLSANCGTFKVSGIVCQNKNARKRNSCHRLRFDRTSASQPRPRFGYSVSLVTLQMNAPARLNLDAGIFAVSDRQTADIAEQDPGVSLLRHEGAIGGLEPARAGPSQLVQTHFTKRTIPMSPAMPPINPTGIEAANASHANARFAVLFWS
jgi:hypothetical protein